MVIRGWYLKRGTEGIRGRQAQVGSPLHLRAQCSPSSDHIPLRLIPEASEPRIIDLPAAATLKMGFTAQDGGKGKRPHQAFLTLQDPASGLEESFAFAVSDNGKAKLDIVC